MVLSAPKVTANLYCICLSIDFRYTWVNFGTLSNSEIGAHIQRNICYFICLRHLTTSRAVTNRFFFIRKEKFLHACAACSELPYNIRTMKQTWRFYKYMFFIDLFTSGLQGISSIIRQPVIIIQRS